MFEILEEKIHFQRNLDRQKGKMYSRLRVFFLFSFQLALTFIKGHLYLPCCAHDVAF